MRRAVVVDFMPPADLVGREHAVLDQQGFQRQEFRFAVAQRHVVVFAGRMGRVTVRVVVLMAMLVIVIVFGH